MILRVRTIKKITSYRLSCCNFCLTWHSIEPTNAYSHSSSISLYQGTHLPTMQHSDLTLKALKQAPCCWTFPPAKLTCPVIGRCYVLLSFSVCTAFHSTCIALHESQLSTQGQIAGKDFMPICLKPWKQLLMKCSPIHLDCLTLHFFVLYYSKLTFLHHLMQIQLSQVCWCMFSILN